MIRPITTAQVIRIYDSRVNCGVLVHPGLLDGAVQAPFQEVFDLNPYPTLVQKAGKLLDGIQRVQAYSDGNKRLAWLATTSFLQTNGLIVQDTSAASIDEFVRSLAGAEEPEVLAARWLNGRTYGTA